MHTQHGMRKKKRDDGDIVGSHLSWTEWSECREHCAKVKCLVRITP